MCVYQELRGKGVLYWTCACVYVCAKKLEMVGGTERKDGVL